MKLTTTFRLLRKAHACPSRYEFLRKALPRDQYDDDSPINLLTILETNGLDDALWALSATAENCDKGARLMAADFAEEVLPIWQKYYPEDDRPEKAIKAARDFAHGRIEAAARYAAEAAARAAAGAAAQAAARAAARAAAGYAARAAAEYAAEAAAQTAAEAAAQTAAWAAAQTAAWAAARDRQREIFRRYLQPEI